MAKKIEIIGSGVFITDTISGIKEVSQLAKDTWYLEKELINSRIQMYDTNGTNDLANKSVFPTIALAVAVDSTGTPFTASTFRTFCTDNLGKSSLVTGAIERLIDGESTAISQNPTGLGIANSIQVEYGAAIGNANTDVMLALDGTLTFNKAGTYRIKIAIQFGRVGNPSASKILFRVIDSNGDQLGRSVGYLISSGDETKYFENDTWLPVTAGLTVRTEVMRDSSGVNTGGLVSITPTDEGVNTWNFAPTAAIRVERFI